MNPYDLTLGEFTTNVAAGNEQGVYYTYTAAASGKLTVEWLSGANAGIVLYNENSYAQVSLAEASDGKTVTIDVNKGDVIQIIVSTVPDQNFNYPAATIKAKASLGS